MLVCPACGFTNADDSVRQCGRCHLAAALFPAVREAVGVPESDPAYLQTVAEVLKAVDAESQGLPGDDPGTVAPNRHLGASRSPPNAPGDGGSVLPSLPKLSEGANVAALRRQADEYLVMGRRLGMDFTDFEERSKEAVLADSAASFEALNREMFVHLAAHLTEELDAIGRRRDELAAMTPTSTADVDLESARKALEMGDLGGAQRRLDHVDARLEELADEWATVMILITESDLIAETIRELGGDPTPALGPLEEARRLARDGLREEAEPLLARTAHGLWAILNPLFSTELNRLKEAVLRAREGGRDISPSVRDLKELGVHLKHRNFAAAISAYRRLRDRVDAWSGPTVAGDAPTTEGPSASPG